MEGSNIPDQIPALAVTDAFWKLIQQADRKRNVDGDSTGTCQAFQKNPPREFRLVRPVDSFDELRDLFRVNTVGVEPSFIWMSENAMMHKNGNGEPRTKQFFHVNLCLSFLGKTWGQTCSFAIHALSEEAAAECVKLILNLKKIRSYEALGWGWTPEKDTTSLLDMATAVKMFQDVPTVFFRNCRILPGFSHALASHAGKKNELGFYSSTFTDNGDALINAVEENPNGTAIRKITFRAGSGQPFHTLCRKNMQRLLSLEQKTEVEFLFCSFDAYYCSAFSAVGVESLVLHACKFEDNMQALVHGMKNGHGPRKIEIGDGMMDKFFIEKRIWQPFLQFIGNPSASSSLHSLTLNCSPNMTGDKTKPNFFCALSTALKSNVGLESLRVEYDMAVVAWADIMLSVLAHPSLKSLNLKVTYRQNSYSQTRNINRANVAAQLLQTNHLIEEMEFCGRVFDSLKWEELVEPLLECNVYRKKIQSLNKQDAGVSWNAIFAQAMARMSSLPTPMWMLVSQNQDVLVASIEKLDQALHNQVVGIN